MAFSSKEEANAYMRKRRAAEKADKLASQVPTEQPTEQLNVPTDQPYKQLDMQPNGPLSRLLNVAREHWVEGVVGACVVFFVGRVFLGGSTTIEQEEREPNV